MSFSGKVREELAGNISSARHCRIAELAAFIGMCGTIAVNSFDQYSIKIHSENFLVARKVFTLIEKTFNIKVDVSIRRNIKRQNATYSVVVRQHEDARCSAHPSGSEDDRRKCGLYQRYPSFQSAGAPADVLPACVSPRSLSGIRVHERSEQVLSF